MTTRRHPQRLTQAQRIRQRTQFAAALNSNCRVKSEHFRVCARRTGEPQSRLGIIVSKRIVRTAVARNAIKRLVREVFRRAPRGLLAMDFVVHVQSNVPRQKKMAAAEALNELLRKLQQSASQCAADSGRPQRR